MPRAMRARCRNTHAAAAESCQPMLRKVTKHNVLNLRLFIVDNHLDASFRAPGGFQPLKLVQMTRLDAEANTPESSQCTPRKTPESDNDPWNQTQDEGGLDEPTISWSGKYAAMYRHIHMMYCECRLRYGARVQTAASV